MKILLKIAMKGLGDTKEFPTPLFENCWLDYICPCPLLSRLQVGSGCAPWSELHPLLGIQPSLSIVFPAPSPPLSLGVVKSTWYW